MISAIAAIGKGNRVLGNKGKIPWHIPEDFAYFKEKTMGHPIIMGRKTFETFPKLLQGRTHIVVTRNTAYAVPAGVFVATSITDAVAIAQKQSGSEEIFIIGGGQIYRDSLPFVDRLYITLIEGDFVGDAFFPEYKDFNKIIDEKNMKNDNHECTFFVLEKS